MLPDVLLTILGWVLLALAILAAAWFAAGDRLRHGKARRCPKCWYDLSHTPGLTCSECGYTARREPQLHRRRRKWRWALPVVLLFACSWVAFKGPAVKARGWFAAVPTSAFLVFFEHLVYPTQMQYQTLSYAALPTPPPPAPWRVQGGDELVHVRAPSMWRWQRWLFLRRASKAVDPLGAASKATVAYLSPTASTVPEWFIVEETRGWNPAQPSAHAMRLWKRIVEDVIVTRAAGDGRVSIEVMDSLWHRGDRWRSVLVWVEGEKEPCLARLVSPLGLSGMAKTEATVNVAPDGVLRLRVQLTEPSPPRTDVMMAEHAVIWETTLVRHFDTGP